MVNLNNLLSKTFHPCIDLGQTHVEAFWVINYWNPVHLTFDEYRVSSLYFPKNIRLRIILVDPTPTIYHENATDRYEFNNAHNHTRAEHST